jgi:hypothetical protein
MMMSQSANAVKSRPGEIAEESANQKAKELGDYWAQFLIEGTPSKFDWNSSEEYEKFVKAYPGKIPRLNATKILTPRDTYGMKGFHG